MTRYCRTLIALLIPIVFLEAGEGNYVEKDGFVAVEAEHFAAQAKDEIRQWYITDANTPPADVADIDGNHAKGSSGGSYIEILPDNRTNHDEALIHYTDSETDANFAPVPGSMGVLSYPIYFNTAGLYVFWARAYSTGAEDNGLHVGINGTWPEASARVQLCPGKYQWTWSSAQRRSHNHCGEPLTVLVSIPSPGLHTIMLSMREDGYELDKFIMTTDFNFVPEGESIPASIREESGLSRGNYFADVGHYDFRLDATANFFHQEGSVPYYIDKRNHALAINAADKIHRDSFSAATARFDGKPGAYKISLITLTETDGESVYRVSANGKLLGTFTNPETSTDYREVIFDCGVVDLEKKDEIKVEFNAVTNGKIPENDETAYSRGRWRGLILTSID
jgi:hypothetical protein